MKSTVEKYVDNYYIYHRSKASRNKYKGLLKLNPILVQDWTDITMDFVIDLPEREGYNAILIVTNRLSKERYYIPCSTKENGTDTEATACQMIIRNVLRYHDLPTSIILDRRS